MTEFDCGPTSILNAISYLFDREEIPAELIKVIYHYALDCDDKSGNIGQGGTSRESIKKIVQWLNECFVSDKFNISCIRLEKEQVTLENIRKCLRKNGVVLVRVFQNDEHYVIITNIKEDKVFLFDPYYLPVNYYDNDMDIEIVNDEPFHYNRIVKIDRVFSNEIKDFSMGKLDKRECVLMCREK